MASTTYVHYLGNSSSSSSLLLSSFCYCFHHQSCYLHHPHHHRPLHPHHHRHRHHHYISGILSLARPTASLIISWSTLINCTTLTCFIIIIIIILVFFIIIINCTRLTGFMIIICTVIIIVPRVFTIIKVIFTLCCRFTLIINLSIKHLLKLHGHFFTRIDQ